MIRLPNQSYQFLSVLISSYHFLWALNSRSSVEKSVAPKRGLLDDQDCHSGHIQVTFRLSSGCMHPGCIQVAFRVIQAAFWLHSGRIQAVLGALACSGSAPGARFFRLAASGLLLYVSGEIVTPTMRRSDPERSF